MFGRRIFCEEIVKKLNLQGLCCRLEKPLCSESKIEAISDADFSTMKMVYLYKILHNALTIELGGTKEEKKKTGRTACIFRNGISENATIKKDILKILKPMRYLDLIKYRIGPERDGGYVMAFPFEDKTTPIYSFGVGKKMDFELTMAKMGYKIWQWDGTIEQPPTVSPDIHFNKFNITGSNEPGNKEVNLSMILRELGHAQAKDIILQIDIERAEWDFFDTIKKDDMLKFSQIIGEFHFNLTDQKKMEHYLHILEKISETHQSIHFHHNNVGAVEIYADFSFPATAEVTLVRRNGKVFQKDYAEYPTALDAPCNPRWAEHYIGNLEILLHDFSLNNNS